MNTSLVGVLIACVALVGGANPPEQTSSFTPDELALIYKLSPLPPVPRDPTNRVANSPAAARLGQFLFFDKRLSGNGRVSCASCHDPTRNWSDGQPIPVQFSADLRHVPSLWNVAYNRWFFWDGRADSLWSQALDPLEQPKEHGGQRMQYALFIYKDAPLRRAYERVFGAMPDVTDVSRFPVVGQGNVSNPHRGADNEAVNRIFSNLGKALAAFERRIVSRHAPFDVFVEGLKSGDATQLKALDPAAQRGLKLFIGRANCRTCHHGPNFTDGEFHDTGINALESKATSDGGRFAGIHRLLSNPFNAVGVYNDSESGRAQTPTAFLQNDTEHLEQFKTPSLRNVAVTAPYMHRGQLATLEDVMRFYSTLRGPGLAASQSTIAAPTAPQGQSKHTHTGPNEHVLIPLNLSKGESRDLIAFLSSLTDVNIDPALTTQPASPEYP